MPLVLLQYKQGRELKELAEQLAQALPEIVAPHLNIVGRERHDGGVTPDEIIVRCSESNPMNVNTRDIEMIILAHEFPERKANLEDRKNGILADVLKFFADYDRNVDGFVMPILINMAYGAF